MDQLIPFHKPNTKSEEWENDGPPQTKHTLTQVVELFDPFRGSWDQDMVCDMFWGEDAKIILALPVHEDRPNKLPWNFDPKGLFSVRSAYKVCRADHARSKRMWRPEQWRHDRWKNRCVRTKSSIFFGDLPWTGTLWERLRCKEGWRLIPFFLSAVYMMRMGITCSSNARWSSRRGACSIQIGNVRWWQEWTQQKGSFMSVSDDWQHITIDVISVLLLSWQTNT